ncbi:MAG TPA: DUF3667 domain-containing protein [Rhodanobacter sp.]|nr:DUF3667 domain-containing protein [Rhodanobacter sp.]
MTQDLTTPTELQCANCGALLQGEFCHVCGQSVHSVLKPVHGMLEDTLDLVLNVDGRVVHTLPPLLLRPGFLTLEYFAGRRVRYLAPFRLMFALCLLAFFVLPMALDSGDALFVPDVHVQGSSFQRAKTPAEVDRLLKKQLAQLAPTRDIPVVGSLAGKELDKARLQLVREAMQRRIELGDKTAVIPTSLDEVPEPPVDTRAAAEWEQRNPFDQHWDMQKYPVKVSWLPDFLNQRLNRSLARVHDNLAAMSGPGDHSAVNERLIGQVFAALPGAMFFMLPAFALLLKLVYLFKRRLYVEHLIVALHSHAFLFLSLLLGTLIHLLGTALKPHAPWLGGPLNLLTAALWLWAPTYLLIMQKRVYRQGWPMTVLKYLFVGWCYCWLLAIAFVGAGVLGLAE